LVSNESTKTQSNLLYRLAALYGTLLGTLLILGAFGHIQGVWMRLIADSNLPISSKLPLLLPGVILAATGLLNFLFFRALWEAKEKAQSITLLVNVIASIYFAKLLHQGIPDHPIGLFLSSSLCHVILLSVIHAGLSWPAKVKN